MIANPQYDNVIVSQKNGLHNRSSFIYLVHCKIDINVNKKIR